MAVAQGGRALLALEVHDEMTNAYSETLIAIIAVESVALETSRKRKNSQRQLECMEKKFHCQHCYINPETISMNIHVDLRISYLFLHLHRNTTHRQGTAYTWDLNHASVHAVEQNVCCFSHKHTPETVARQLRVEHFLHTAESKSWGRVSIVRAFEARRESRVFVHSSEVF